MRVLRLLNIIVASAAFDLLMPPAATASTFYEADFSTPTLDSFLDSALPAQMTLTTGGGTANIAYTKGAGFASYSGQIFTEFLIDGDFESRLTADLSGLSASGGDVMNVFFGVTLANDAGARFVSSNGETTGDVTVADGSTIGGVALTGNSVTYRIIRSGNTLSADILDGASFRRLGEWSDDSLLGDAMFSFGTSYMGTNAVTNGVARFSNFTLADVDVVESAVPEPATWALMIVGFGMVGGVMRRRQTLALI